MSVEESVLVVLIVCCAAGLLLLMAEAAGGGGEPAYPRTKRREMGWGRGYRPHESRRR